jgi:predicted Zn-dependent peptidase
VKDTGLFGLYLVGEQENMDSALECVAAGIKRLAVRGTVEEAELRRAKTQLKV